MPETERRTSNVDSSVTDESRNSELSDDAFLGSQLQILQPKVGYRAGIDAVFLAASTPALPGETVLEIGAGVGVASLCLAKRVPGLQITGLEIQKNLVTIAKENVRRNGLQDNVSILEGDLFKIPKQLSQLNFDHVIVNPPYYQEGNSIGAPNRSKFIATVVTGMTIEDWVAFALRRLKPNGCFTLIYLSEQLDRLLSCIKPKAGKTKIFPLWPKATSSASRVIISSIKGSEAPVCLLPGLVLHQPGGRYTAEAESVLRKGKACRVLYD